ncbi:MAG: ribbon-helix-helix protein, CopG family [Methanomicrobiales archaeon]|nr:ribbon-helix-helix protein, CopG family [Methanomicrobiales archaeon]
MLVELDDSIVARLQKLAEREGINFDELLENLIALYGGTCD